MKQKPKKAAVKKAKKPVKKPAAKHVKKIADKGKKGKAKPLTKLEKAIKVNATEINELIERGRPRGFVTDNEILYYFPKIEDNVDLLDEIYDRLEKAGIKVIETSALIDFSKDEKSETIDDSMAFEGDVPDAVQMYLKEIGKTPLLTKDEERDLAKRAEKGDEEARQRLMKANLRLVVSIAKRYVNRTPHLEHPRSDPGGEHRPFARRRKIRLPPRFQIFDLRHVVDPPGDHARAGRPVAHGPHPGAHGGDDLKVHAGAPPADPGAWPRSARRRDRRGDGH